MKTDVLLLADIFERFYEPCLSYYGLDLGHYNTAPGLSWDAMLEMTGVSLELFADPYMFIENGIRGDFPQTQSCEQPIHPRLRRRARYTNSQLRFHMRPFSHAHSLADWPLFISARTREFRCCNAVMEFADIVSVSTLMR